MATLTCPNCGRDVDFNGSDAEAICAACPVGGADGDTHFDPGVAPVSEPDDSDIEQPETDPADAGASGDEQPAGNQSGSEPPDASSLPTAPTANAPVRPEEPSA